MTDGLDDLAALWRWFAGEAATGHCPLYEEIARSVADDRDLLALQYSARPQAHLPLMLLASAHYLLLGGVDHPLGDVYAGRSMEAAAPLFKDLCLQHSADLLEVLNARRVQTNEVGRSALLGPALTWAADEEPLQIVDVGCSAGLNLLCDQFLLNYGSYGTTGPADSPVRVDCRVRAGAPPITPLLPSIAGRVGIDLEPPDLNDPDDARWLLACVWPGTGRFQRTARAIELARANPPPVIRGPALERLPQVLEGLGDGRIVIVNSWSFSYFSIDERRAYVELLSDIGHHRPIVWVSMESKGVVDLPTEAIAASSDERDVVIGCTFDHATSPRSELLAFVQSHGSTLDWRGSKQAPAH